MGQLERYGLYVLCVVIFLILGVALWGGDPSLNGPVVNAPSVTRDLNASQPEGRTPSALTAEAPPAVAPAEHDDAVSRLRRQFGSSSEADRPAHAADAGSLQAEPLAGVGNAGGPAPESARGPASPAAATVDYVVKKGDTLEEIAEAHFGKGKGWAWQEIVKVNSGLRPTKMKVGDTIKLPPPSVLDKGKSDAAPATADEYVIKSGDNLESIALAKLGKRSLWRDIEAANPGLNAARLRPGARIKIPTTAGDTKH